MAKRTQCYGLNNPLQNIFPVPVVAQRAPVTSDAKAYELGQQWIDTSSNQVYVLTNVSGGSATWTITGPGASDVDTLTGDSGGALSPTAGNINILGGDGITVAGSGSTLTVNRDAEGGYPITPYVVGIAGQAGYQTIQSALDAANTAKIASGNPQSVYVQPGTYVEDLTLYADITIVGVMAQVDSEVFVIQGVHTLPSTGQYCIYGAWFKGTTEIFVPPVGGGDSQSNHFNCIYELSGNGYTFNIDGYSGQVNLFDTLQWDGGGNNGFVYNPTGNANVFMISGGVGLSANPLAEATISGTCLINNIFFGIRLKFVGTANVQLNMSDAFNGRITLEDSATVDIANSYCLLATEQAFLHNSTGALTISSCGINSTAATVIDGTGTGAVTLTGVDFVQNKTIAATLTIDSTSTSMSGIFETSAAAAGLQISGSDIDADGSDTDISITLSPKGAGNVVVDVGDIQDTAGDIIATRSSAGGDVTVEATNSDNTDPASRGGFEAAVGGTSAGDPYVNFLISGGQAFTMGIDNSTTNDDFVIADSAALGTTNRISIDGSTGIVTTVSGLTSTGTTSILDSVNANTSINGGTSTGTVTVGNSAAGAITVDTAAGISIDGATASNFTVTGAADLTASSTAGSVVIDGGEAVADAVQITASDAAGGVTISSGTGNVNVSGNLVLSDVATQLQMNGGAVTDFIGTATLTAGTVSVANTNIAATDRIFIQRQSVNSSTAIGNLTYTITASTSFAITSVQDASPGTTETNDVSIVMYWIVREN